MRHLMEGEALNLIMVWTTAAATVCYCRAIGNFIPKGGSSRFAAIFPAIVILLLLPLRLTSVHLGGPTAFILSWLTTFKLLLFSFGKGPLHHLLPLRQFVPLSLLPIKLQNYPPEIQRPSLNYAFPTAIVVLATLIPLYTAKQSLHPKFVLFLYSLHMYIGLEFIFFVFSFFTRKLLGVQLEPQFDQPYLSTSLQDFWGRRWNIVVHKVLQPTVYQPVVTAATRLLGTRWAPLPAILATFAVSAAMHELVFYYIKRERRGAWEPWEPSWDAICFFMLHGTCLAFEVAVKKWLRARGSKWRLPGMVSWILTVAFVYETALRLFFPALARCRVYEKATRELNAVMEFGKEVYGVLRFACFHVTRNEE
ncbi:probable long-chain-alcohol O-fatty-acyltransferase 5 [Arachis stenosperma]|uniref:probable long-chain-alcohol O-fatty-acyltransferase 5 n=1 Tax=Arachis stenosperma TaxID=217475 RepID=UPI0025ABFA73|nr:probable long-chain-alcohol O-fatty-acyltransferase 5 [Arachis stenosperma]